MLSAKETFIRLFPQEQIEEEISGYYTSSIKHRNTMLGNIPYSIIFEYQPGRKCDVILGTNNLLIDIRQVMVTNIKIFLLLIPIAIIIMTFYTLNTNNLLVLFISLFSSWPVPLAVLIFWISAVKGGASSLLFDRKWIKEMSKELNFQIKGTIPGGKPYILSQYLAMNNINIPETLSGKTAWFGTQYPWKFVETDFDITVHREMKNADKLTYIIFSLCVFLIWISIHLTFIIIPILLNQFNSVLTAPL